VRQVIRNWSYRIPALTMKLWIEHSLRQQIAVDASVPCHLSKEICSALSAPGTRRCSQSKDFGISTRHRNGRCREKAHGISFTVHGLTVVAMTVILQHWLAVELYLHGTAGTVNGRGSHQVVTLGSSSMGGSIPLPRSQSRKANPVPAGQTLHSWNGTCRKSSNSSLSVIVPSAGT
jgi:hypothetical protein